MERVTARPPAAVGNRGTRPLSRRHLNAGSAVAVILSRRNPRLVWQYGAVSRRTTPADAVADASVTWLRDRLAAPQSGLVSSVVPGGFEAYVRILHPAQTPEQGGPLVRWIDVSKWSGVELHPRVQWLDVALPQIAPTTDPPWRHQGPLEGSLCLDDTLALIDDLMPFTTSPNDCLFGLWSGYGGGGATLSVGPDSVLMNQPHRFRPPRTFVLPGREYELFEGPLAGAAHFELNGHQAQSPSLWWPADHSWCVASEIDLAWSYVGGSARLIDALLADERIETLRAAPDDSFWLTLPRWLIDLIDGAVDEVLSNGSVNLTLATGDVEVSLRRLDRRGHAVVVARSNRLYGWAGSNTPVKMGNAEQLRRDIRFAIQHAVQALV